MTTARKILIVEDHKPLRNVLSFLLSRAGYEIFETAGAISALPADLTDLVLPTGSFPTWKEWGAPALRADETTARIPVIMVSGKEEK